MAYTKNIWLEYGMNTTARIAALNNLETMYSASITYIDNISHSVLYYTDAEAAAMFFSAATDGTGSGLIAMTVDGYTAQQLLDSSSPPGVIAYWSGSVANIPVGWLLCNGLNSTPNLQDKFIVGAGGDYTIGYVGGINTITTSATVTIAAHALTAAEIALHTHGTITDNYCVLPLVDGVYNAGSIHGLATQENAHRHTGSMGGGSAHGHTGSTWTGTATQLKTPPFYSLCYIIKS